MFGLIKLTPAQNAVLGRAIRRHARLGDCTLSRDLTVSFKDYEGAAAVMNTIGEMIRKESRGYVSKLSVLRKINAAIGDEMADRAEAAAEVKASKIARQKEGK